MFKVGVFGKFEEANADEVFAVVDEPGDFTFGGVGEVEGGDFCVEAPDFLSVVEAEGGGGEGAVAEFTEEASGLIGEAFEGVMAMGEEEGAVVFVGEMGGAGGVGAEFGREAFLPEEFRGDATFVVNAQAHGRRRMRKLGVEERC